MRERERGGQGKKHIVCQEFLFIYEVIHIIDRFKNYSGLQIRYFDIMQVDMLSGENARAAVVEQ